MTSGTFEQLWERLETARQSYALLIDGPTTVVSKSDKLTVLRENLEDILQEAEDELFDQWEYDEILSTGITLLNAVDSALCSTRAMDSD